MEAVNIRKPDWSKEPEKVDFKLINKPLEEVYNSIISKLDKENRELKNFYFILKGLLTTSFNTYKAIWKLVATEPKYAMQAHILNRSLIDALFTIIALTENPEENARKYEKAGYRINRENYEREKNRYSSDTKWQGLLKEKEKYLEFTVKLLKLSTDEIDNPKSTIDYWPNPYQLIKIAQSDKPKIPLSPEKQEFLDEICKWRYSEISDWAHIGWSGMAMGIFATMPEHHWYPGKFESDAVASGILFLLMILSEIEASCRYGEIQKLRYTWTILNSFFGEAKDYYDLRYDSLLK